MAEKVLIDSKALAATDFASETSVSLFVLATGSKSTKSAWANMVAGLFRYGAAHRKDNVEPKTDGLIAAYMESRKAVGGPGPLAKDSIPVHASVIRTLVNAGRVLPYVNGVDSDAVETYIGTEVGSLPWSNRGGLVNRIVADFPKDVPTIDELRVKYSDNSDDNVTDAVIAVRKRVLNLSGDKSAATRKTLASDDVLAARYKDALKALAALEVECVRVLPASPSRERKAKAAPSAESVMLRS